MTLVELITYRRKGHAEHDNQSYVPAGEVDWWATHNDPIDRYLRVMRDSIGITAEEIEATDARVRAEVDAATEVAEASPFPEPLDGLTGIYADPPNEQPLWFREGAGPAVARNERAEGWGTWNAPPSAGGAR